MPPLSTAARRLLGLAALSGALAVALGAFGAHGLGESIGEGRLNAYDVGARYHLVHAVALAVMALSLGALSEAKWAGRAAWVLFAGTALFSGTLYIHGAFGAPWLMPITPIGGVLMIAGWTLYGAAVLRGR